MAGTVARFLATPSGRAYLARVPGVAFVNLSNSEVADLLTWMVRRFDSENVPPDFVPYSAEEIQIFRGDALISEAYAERRRLLRLIQSRSE